MVRKRFLVSLLVLLIPISFALSPIIIDAVSINDEIKSNEAAVFNLTLINNQNVADDFIINAPFSKWDITFSDYFVTIPAKSSELISVRLAPPMFTSEGRYAIFIKAQSQNSLDISNYNYIHVTVTEEIRPEMADSSREVIISEEVSESWLRSSYSFTIDNTGTVLYEDSWTDIFSQLEIFLLESNLEYDVEEYGKDRLVSWSYAIEPGESIIINYSVSYVPVLLGFLLLLGASGLFVYHYKNKFNISKTLTRRKSSILIQLSVKNNTNVEQKNVRVEDVVPHPLKVVREFGTVVPSQIVRGKNGTQLVWKFGSLAPKEERLISYEVRSEIHILGRLQLPQARLTQGKVKLFSGKTQITGK